MTDVPASSEPDLDDLAALPPAVVWLTGLPCSGKTTVAIALEDALRGAGVVTTVLDGDVLRRTTSADLGFSDEARCEQARRAARAAAQSLGEGAFVVVALVSPLQRAREEARRIVGPAYFEVFVDAAPELCEQRDVKGMYRLARAGELQDFTGVSAPFERPVSPDLRLDTAGETPAASAARVLAALAARARPAA